MRRVGFAFILVGVALGAFFFLTGCAGDSTAESQRERSVSARAKAFARAESAVPLPKTVNFPLRKVLSEMTVREDMVNHPWYTYILGDNGNILGYYVSTTVPVNKCNFLGSTEETNSNSNGRVVLTAPSLDGMYYGQSQCDAWVFQDAETGALITIRGVRFYSSDQPLRLDAEPIEVRGS